MKLTASQRWRYTYSADNAKLLRKALICEDLAEQAETVSLRAALLTEREGWIRKWRANDKA